MSATTKLSVYAQLQRNSKTFEAELSHKGLKITLTDFLPLTKNNVFLIRPERSAMRVFCQSLEAYLLNRQGYTDHVIDRLSNIECRTVGGYLVLDLFALGGGWIQIQIWRGDTVKVFEMNVRDSEIKGIFVPIEVFFR